MFKKSQVVLVYTKQSTSGLYSSLKSWLLESLTCLGIAKKTREL
jgi:hypothetical protein